MKPLTGQSKQLPLSTYRGSLQDLCSFRWPLTLRRLARNGATVEGLAKRTGRTPDFIERALSWDAGSVSRGPVGSFGDLAPRGAQMSPRLDLLQ